MSKIFSMSVAKVYPLYLQKLERKGRTKAELDEVLEWLTGFTPAEVAAHLAAGTTFEDFFAAAHLNPNTPQITGVICGVRVEEVADPLMQKIRYLDKLVDEAARGTFSLLIHSGRTGTSRRKSPRPGPRRGAPCGRR